MLYFYCPVTSFSRKYVENLNKAENVVPKPDSPTHNLPLPLSAYRFFRLIKISVDVLENFTNPVSSLHGKYVGFFNVWF